MQIDPGDAGSAIKLQVEIADTGPKTWPAENLFVIDEVGQAVPIRRDGLEWHRFSMTVPAVKATYMVSAVTRDSAKPNAELPTERERTASDRATGVRASVCKWYGGRDAALSVRFDDSNPTHLKTVIPILREYGFRATFMINPGKQDYLEHRAEWEACAKQGEHEFGNHTMNHRGAATDEEIESEIGQVSQYIWQLFPARSELVALNLGGGTEWVTRNPFSYYLDKYHLFNVSGSLGMDDVYGKRVDALERHLLNTIAGNGWARVHYHAIGPGLSSSEQNFRTAMELVKKHAGTLWITGLADAIKYQEERKTTKIDLTGVATDRVELAVVCGTDPILYDQPLTVRFDVPADWSASSLTTVRKEGDRQAIAESELERGPGFIRCHVPPESRSYVLVRNR